jgi:hypothetical protein
MKSYWATLPLSRSGQLLRPYGFMDAEEITKKIVERVSGDSQDQRIQSFLQSYETSINECMKETDFLKAFNLIKEIEMRLAHIRDEKIGFLNIDRFKEWRESNEKNTADIADIAAD